MSALTDLQIDLIRGDIRRGGVEMPELEDDLLDHVCCALEERFAQRSGATFESLYPEIRAQVCPDGWHEVQAETTYLLTYKYNKMKRLNNIIGLAGACMLILGTAMKIMQLMGASIVLCLGAVVISLVYFPMVLTLGLREPGGALTRLRQISGPIGASIMVIGVLFKMMHWPWATIIAFSGLLLVGLGFLPLWFITLRRENKLQVQPMSVGILLLIGTSVLFSFSNVSNSWYFNVTALQINQEIESDYQQQIEFNKVLLADLTPEAAAQTEAVSTAAQEVQAYADWLKEALVSVTGAHNDHLNDLDPRRTVAFHPEETDPFLFDASGSELPKVQQLEQRLSAFVTAYQDVTGHDAAMIPTALQFTQRDLHLPNDTTWAMHHFRTKPLFVILTHLSRIEQAVAQLHGQALLWQREKPLPVG